MVKVFSGLAFGLLAALHPESAVAQQSWTWKLAPYLLAPNIDGEASLGRLESIGLAVNPADIIDRLNIGFMAYLEGYHDSGWGFNVDYGFMDLEDSGSFGPGGAGSAEADIFQGVLTAVVFRRVVDTPEMDLDLYGGIRWWDTTIDVNATLGPVTGDVSMGDSWLDPHFGLKLERFLPNSKWSLNAQADVGGFGVGSDFAWTAALGATWHATDRLAVEFGYRAQGVDFESGVRGTPTHFRYDTVTHGPRVGLLFKF